MISETSVTFAAESLDRADHLRSDETALKSMIQAPESRALPFWRGKPLFELGDDGPRLGWVAASDDIVANAPDKPLFLGLDETGAAYFAVEASYLAPPEETPAEFIDRSTLELSETRKFIDLRAILGEVTQEDAGHAATAKGVFEWWATHRFCARCGQPNTIGGAGWRMDCTSCGRQHFPRTDPVVIMLILDGDRVLLGRQSFWPDRMYSLLAGFMEPGESIESAVRREVMEEAGVEVGEVSYLVSQPWPFPGSLMIGCAGKALTTDIKIDETEIEDAFWVSKHEIAEALEGRNDKIAPARKGAVAQIILSAWAHGDVENFD